MQEQDNLERQSQQMHQARAEGNEPDGEKLGQHTERALRRITGYAVGSFLLLLLVIGGVALISDAMDHPDELWEPSLAIVAGLFGTALVILVIQGFVRRRLPSRTELLELFLKMPVQLFAAVGSWACAIRGIVFVYMLASSFSDALSMLFIGLLTFAFGGALFAVRLYYRFLYGASEIAIGVFVAVYRYYSDHIAATNQSSISSLTLTILTAGVYLVVRGGDNMHQGLVKPPLDPHGQKLLRWLNRLGQK